MIITQQVTTLEQAQLVRMIRNELRQHMTGYNSVITSREQIKWFESQRGTLNKLYLYYNEDGSVVGFSYMRYMDSKYWGTLAVLPEFQGMGYGTSIYQHMVELCGELWVEIFSDNNPSLISALKAGFTIQSVGDKTITLKSN